MESQAVKFLQPSDELLIRFLKKKRLDPRYSCPPIKDVDHICSFEPWDLAKESETESEYQFRYFFYEPYYKYRQSKRVHRRTEAGQWKITTKDSQIEAGNGLTGTKKILTFYLRGPDSKTDWVMHEYHVKDDPGYKKEFVLCGIKRRRNKKKKRGISTTDEGESSQQLVSQPQESPCDHSISNGNHSEKNNHTIPQQQLPNHNSNSYPGNFNVQNTSAYPQSITNDSPTQLSPSNRLISKRNHNYVNTPTNQPPLQNHKLIPFPGNHSEQTTQIYPQQLSHINSISHPGNRIEQHMYSSTYSRVIPSYSPPQQLSYEHFSPARNYSAVQTPISFSAVQTPISQEPELKYSNGSSDDCDFYDSIVFREDSPRAFQDESPLEETGQTFTPDFNPSKSDGEASAYAEDSSDTNTADNNAWVNELRLKKDECLVIGEFKLYGGNNTLNDAFFSAVQTPNYQEPELVCTKSSLDNSDFSDGQIYSDEQETYLINSPRAFPDVNSREETGQTLTPVFHPSKSDGHASAYAEDSGDKNTAYNDAWIKERLENLL